MIQTKRTSFKLHVKLLGCTMKILKVNLHSHLKKSDGLIFNIFSISGVESIVEFTILQFIDVMYAQLLPVAWGKPSTITSEIYVTLMGLRDELGKVIHITETVSKLLCKHFKCQKWQKSSSFVKTWFVSSISCDYASNYWSQLASSEGKILTQYITFHFVLKCIESP